MLSEILSPVQINGSQVIKNVHKRTTFKKSMTAGAFAGTCLVTSGHALDLVKVRLQTQPYPPIYNGMLDCIYQTFQREGLRGLYRGMSAPLVSVYAVQSLSFFGLNLGKRILLWFGNKNSLNYKDIFISGMTAGLMMDFIWIPIDRVKCLLQVETAIKANSSISGPLDCIRHLVKSGGVSNLYKGAGITLVRDLPTMGLYFTVYERVLASLISPNETRESVSVFKVYLAGGMAGISRWVFAISPDTLKSRIQSTPIGQSKHMRDVFRELVVNEGYTALYRGFRPVIIRGFLANASLLLGYELAMRYLNYVFPEI